MEGGGSGTWDSPITKGDAGTRIDETNQEPGEQGVSDLATRRYKLAKDFRAPYDIPWDRYRRFLWGDQWANKLRPAWKSRPTMNYTFAGVMSIIPMMTDNNPTVNVVGKEQQWAAPADAMQDVVRKILRDEKFLTKSVYVLTDSHSYGTGHLKVFAVPDPEKEGQYRIKLAHIDTRFFYLSPGALDIQSAAYVMYCVNRWIPAIKKDFPEFKGKIPAGTWDEALTHKPVDTQKTMDADGTFTFSQQSVMVSQVTTPTLDQSQMATQCEMWDRNPDGTVWCTILANGVVVKPRFRPYKHKLFPFCRELCYPIPSQYWGMGEVAQLESPQDSVNRAEAMIADIARICTSPQMLISRSSRISLKDITNRVGGFIIHETGQPPVWMPPPSVPDALFRIVQESKLHMDNMSGVHDAARGQLPGGEKISGVAIQSLQAATSSRVGLKTRLYEEFVCEVALHIIELVKEFYIDRVVHVGGGKYIAINKFTDQGMENDIEDAEFEVEIGVGSTLPVDKGIRFDQGVQIFQVTQGKGMSIHELIRRSGVTEEEVSKILEEVEQEAVEQVGFQAKLQAFVQKLQAKVQGPQQQAPQGMPGGAGGAPAPSGAPPAPQGGGPQSDVPSEDEIAALEAKMSGRQKSQAALASPA